MLRSENMGSFFDDLDTFTTEDTTIAPATATDPPTEETIIVSKETSDILDASSTLEDVKVSDSSIEKENVPQDDDEPFGPTIIGPSCIINGNVSDNQPTTIYGTVNGNLNVSRDVFITKTGTVSQDVSVDGKLVIEGHIGGTIDAKEIILQEHAKTHGDMKADRNVTIHSGCVVIGNISCTSIKIEGAIKGDVVVSQEANLGANAVVKGNITAGVLNMSPGSILDGTCTLLNKEYDEKAIFGE